MKAQTKFGRNGQIEKYTFIEGKLGELIDCVNCEYENNMIIAGIFCKSKKLNNDSMVVGCNRGKRK